jgi:hypothetical protein
MEAARTSETLVYFYQATRRYNPEDSHLRTHRHENLKSHVINFCLQKNSIKSNEVCITAKNALTRYVYSKLNTVLHVRSCKCCGQKNAYDKLVNVLYHQLLNINIFSFSLVKLTRDPPAAPRPHFTIPQSNTDPQYNTDHESIADRRFGVSDLIRVAKYACIT